MNPDHSSYLRRLAEEFGESTNAIRVELNRLEEAKLLISNHSGRQKWYSANKSHPLFPELNSIVKKVMGFDKLLDEVLQNLGQLEMALVIGDYARGIDSGVIELVVIGEVDRDYLAMLTKKVEKMIKRTVYVLGLSLEEYKQKYSELAEKGCLLIWKRNTELRN